MYSFNLYPVGKGNQSLVQAAPEQEIKTSLLFHIGTVNQKIGDRKQISYGRIRLGSCQQGFIYEPGVSNNITSFVPDHLSQLRQRGRLTKGFSAGKSDAGKERVLDVFLKDLFYANLITIRERVSLGIVTPLTVVWASLSEYDISQSGSVDNGFLDNAVHSEDRNFRYHALRGLSLRNVLRC